MNLELATQRTTHTKRADFLGIVLVWVHRGGCVRFVALRDLANVPLPIDCVCDYLDAYRLISLVLPQSGKGLDQ